MEFEQALRKVGRDARARIAGVQAHYASARSAKAAAAAEPFDVTRETSPWRLRPSVLVGILGAVGLALFYIVSAWWMSFIDDDLAFAPKIGSLERNQSAAVAAVAALIDREVNGHGWTPNDPFFSPTALLNDMPNFQRGIVAALARVSLALAEKNSSTPDPDFKHAAELLSYPPDVWLWNPWVSFWSGSSELQYRKAIEALNGYNTRLAAGEAVFGRDRADLAAALDAIAADLGAKSTATGTLVRDHAGVFFDDAAGDLFYTVKGGLYAYYIVLKEMYGDFAPVIAAHGQQENWERTIESLEEGARMRPMVVLNGSPDSEFVPCHLCNQGFYLSRARENMRDLADGLRR